jgi:hypothetical protein
MIAAVVSLVVAMLSFQVGAAVAKQLIPMVGAPGTTALRLGISAVLLIGMQRPWRTVPSRATFPIILAYGISLGTMNFLFYQALRTIPARHAVGPSSPVRCGGPARLAPHARLLLAGHAVGLRCCCRSRRAARCSIRAVAAAPRRRMLGDLHRAARRPDMRTVRPRHVGTLIAACPWCRRRPAGASPGRWRCC